MGTVTAYLAGGPGDGLTVPVDPDAAPLERPCVLSGGRYVLTERVTTRAPDRCADAIAGMPVYEYVPPREARPWQRGVCRCGCRRLGLAAA
jgi:hypothetical protein